MDDISAEKAAQFYSLFVTGSPSQTNARTAEMCKLVENSYRDANIAFANELSMICDKAGINVRELINLANKHPRVNILKPGPGVGGHCIAIDRWFLVSTFPEQSHLIKLSREINNSKPDWVIKKVQSAHNNFFSKKKRKPIIACMGLAFKPDIDDLRESPAVEITENLIRENFDVAAAELKEFKLIDYNNYPDKIMIDFCSGLN